MTHYSRYSQNSSFQNAMLSVLHNSLREYVFIEVCSMKILNEYYERLCFELLQWIVKYANEYI